VLSWPPGGECRLQRQPREKDKAPRSAGVSVELRNCLSVLVPDLKEQGTSTPHPVPRPRKTIGAIMVDGSLDFSDHSLCPMCVEAAKNGGVKVSAYSTLQSPSFFDCIVDLLAQVVQVGFFDNEVFHDSLPCRHSTLSLPMTPPDAPGLILGLGYIIPPVSRLRLA
jgi:hypothetical protein